MTSLKFPSPLRGTGCYVPVLNISLATTVHTWIRADLVKTLRRDLPSLSVEDWGIGCFGNLPAVDSVGRRSYPSPVDCDRRSIAPRHPFPLVPGSEGTSHRSRTEVPQILQTKNIIGSFHMKSTRSKPQESSC